MSQLYQECGTPCPACGGEEAVGVSSGLNSNENGLDAIAGKVKSHCPLGLISQWSRQCQIDH